MLSWIQKNALLVLLRSPTASIRTMKPPDVEANLFSYHLKDLQSQGYVEKIGRGAYALTTKGQRFVGAFSTATNRQHEFIKTVIVLYAKTSDGRYLLFRWSRQPYLGSVGLLHDHMPLGKSLADGIRSAMEDKLGIILEPSFMTSALVKIVRGNELVTHMNAMVYRVPVDEATLPFVSRNGTAFLSRPEDADGIMGGVADFLHRLEDLTEPSEVRLTY